MPARAISIASASVWVARPDASIVYGMSFFSAVVGEHLEDVRRERGAAADHRARAQVVAALLLLVDAGGVGRVGDVHGDREIGLERE